MCNWGLASSLPGRLVVPSRFAEYARWQYMDELSDRERHRWRSLMCAFCWKVTRRHPRRALLLKSPSHTSRVAELRRLFADRVRFVVIERDRDEVIASHLSMSKRLGLFSLERLDDEDALRAMIAADHDKSIAAMHEQLAAVPSSQVFTIAYDDLRTDTIGHVRRAYEHLDLGWNDATEQRLDRYLRREGEYIPQHAKRLRHDRPGGQPAALRPARRLAAIGVAVVAATTGLVAWMWLAHQAGSRFDLAAWPIGFGVGLGALYAAGRVIGGWASRPGRSLS